MINFFLNLISPLKIYAPQGCIECSSMLKLRWQYRGVIRVARGNILSFSGVVAGKRSKAEVFISISGIKNVVKIELPAERLHPCLEVGGEGNLVQIGCNFNPSAERMCWYWFGKGNVLKIGESVTFNANPRIPYLFNRISMGGRNCHINIKDGSVCGLNIVSSIHDACRDWSFECGPNARISGLTVTPNSPCMVRIGAGVQISWNVLIGCGSHALLDEDGNCRNVCSNVIVGDHVWIGTGVVIPGDTVISEGCIVGSNAVVTKSFVQKNVAIGGVPARVIKEKVFWDEDYPIVYIDKRTNHD